MTISKCVGVLGILAATWTAIGADAQTTPAQDCLSDLEFLPGFLLENDAGGEYHLARHGHAMLDHALERARAEACIPVLNEYRGQWRDGHIGVLEAGASALDPGTEPEGEGLQAPGTSREPELDLLSEQSALNTLKSLASPYRAAIEGLLDENEDALSARPNWIIDVHDNIGGNDPTCRSLLPWLLSGEIRAISQDWLVTEENNHGHGSACDELAPDPARAVRTTAALAIDGQLDEDAWRDAPPITALVQREPEEGSPASQPTEVRILYDDEAIYIGARLDDAGPVTTRLGRRDMAPLDSDWFAVTFDSYLDRRTAFRFQTNPGGVQRDAVVTMGADGEQEDLSWDAVWEVATSVDDGGWTVEMRIPFSQLRFRRVAEQVWGIQVERVIGRRGEIAHFAFVPRSEPGGIPVYARLVGIEGIEPRNRLELLPYVVARGEYVDRAANPFRDDTEHGLDAGADLLYRLTPDLTLNATLNPDFGQVEVDPAVVELGVYETFFPERRPFFVEGSEIFRFTGNTSGGQLFYSRRIGRHPQIPMPAAAADVPDATRILGAAKLSGRTGAWSVGVLDAVTGRADARVLDDDGERRLVAEPLTNYSVARLRREAFEGRSAFGAAATSVARQLSAPEARDALHSAAWGGGLDFRHEWDERRWRLTGSVAGSHVRGSEEAIRRTQRMPHHYFQRPDAGHLEVDPDARSLSGYSVGMSLARLAGARWLGSIAAAATSPGYEVNDLGFAMRTDRQDLQASLTWRQNRPGNFIRDWSIDATLRAERNFDGDRLQRVAFLEGTFRHMDFWGAGLHLRHAARAFDDRSTRGGPMMLRPEQTVVDVELFSDPRRPVSVAGGAGFILGLHDGYARELRASVNVQTSPWWNASLGPYLSRGRVPAQYVATVPDPDATATFGARYLFAPLEYTQLRADLRLNVTLTPRLSLETYAQPLIFALDFREVGALVAPRTFTFEPWEGSPPDLGHTVRSLRGNAVLRWEWRPGSTLFLAWQQRRQDIGDDGHFGLRDDAGVVFSAPSDNILVVKATYWLNP